MENKPNWCEKWTSRIEIRSKGNKKQKSKKQKNSQYNIEMLYKARNSVIEFFHDYSSMVSEAKLKATKRTRLKILFPKQMLQRLPIALRKKAI